MLKIEKKLKYAVSIAPSFPIYFDCHPLQLVTALKMVGFTYVEETVTVLPLILEMRKKAIKKMAVPILSESCPKVISIIKEDFPHLMAHVPDIPSPFELHGKMLKEKYGSECITVFLSPCEFKKIENESKKIVDVVLTFSEIEQILNCNIKNSLSQLNKTKFNSLVSNDLRYGILSTDVDGAENCYRFLKEFPNEKVSSYTEILFCKGGCATTAQKNKDVSPINRLIKAWEDCDNVYI